VRDLNVVAKNVKILTKAEKQLEKEKKMKRR